MILPNVPKNCMKEFGPQGRGAQTKCHYVYSPMCAGDTPSPLFPLWGRDKRCSQQVSCVHSLFQFPCVSRNLIVHCESLNSNRTVLK